MESIKSVSLHDSILPSDFCPASPINGIGATKELGFQDLEEDATFVSLQDILKKRAESEASGNLIIYSPDDLSSPQRVSYSTLYRLAKQNSIIIRSLGGFRERQPILIHLLDQWDTIVWFWAVLLADGLPVLSSPLSNVDEHRHKYLSGLSELLGSPICITRNEILPSFDGAHTFQLEPVESLSPQRIRNDSPNADDVEPSFPIAIKSKDEIRSKLTSLAMLMLTSGSTGTPKAVCLTHHQILAAIRGKACVRTLPKGHAFLNWINLDHVASLVEIHLQAMWLGVDQVHVTPGAVVSSPTLFLDLLSRHRVSRSFAPNFFLAKLVSSVEAESNPSSWNLSNLTVLASGGELNDVKTCLAASSIFERYGAPRNVITTGFGMTETCAGAIFNLECPNVDVEKGYSVASLGKCMEGIEMRVTVPTAGRSTTGDSISLAMPGEPGDLEVRGDVVFEGYFRDTHATADAFTIDGWFRTGDQATIDLDGNLHLIGRVKEVININSVKFATSDIQTSVEEAISTYVDRVICFPSRATHTEQITVAFIPKRWPIEPEEMAKIDELATQACILSTGSRPLVFQLLEASVSVLPISTLGKISRAKMTAMFQAGVFTEDLQLHRQFMDRLRKENRQSIAVTTEATTPAEALILEDFIETFDISPEMVGLDTRIYDLGSTSMDIMRLKRRIDSRLGIQMPIITLLKNPTPRSLAAGLRATTHVGSSQFESDDRTDQPATTTPAIEYDPVVTFCSRGTKTPLWLIHPGVGEVLVFVGLSQHLRSDDRPVYALRARGFEAGQDRFTSIDEVVETYVNAIQIRQPHGPYAIAGYSYGTMLAFEIAKKLDATGRESVQFLGSFNLPPHIKTRMRNLNWNMCLLHLSWFLDLISEDYVNSMDEQSFRAETRDKALKKVLAATSQHRLDELGLGEPELIRWTGVAFGLQSMAVDYEPSGRVGAIDIFHAIPLKVAAGSQKEWIEDHLSKWGDFSETEPRFHQVGGAHYTMIGPNHVSSFSKTLIAALKVAGFDILVGLVESFAARSFISLVSL